MGPNARTPYLHAYGTLQVDSEMRRFFGIRARRQLAAMREQKTPLVAQRLSSMRSIGPFDATDFASGSCETRSSAPGTGLRTVVKTTNVRSRNARMNASRSITGKSRSRAPSEVRELRTAITVERLLKGNECAVIGHDADDNLGGKRPAVNQRAIIVKNYAFDFQSQFQAIHKSGTCAGVSKSCPC
jgi:hypothetical protein